ncbi:MAG: hypothetical protein HQL87_04235 [Magnetococcales bacterium]|nr:hypothetical protein [Magnetococcales bacterium]
MNETFSLTLQQVDTINQSLIRASSIAQLLADCGSRRNGEPEPMDEDSVFVVMRILSEELEKIGNVMEAVGGEPSQCPTP